jgi:hypothetical protein
MDGDTFGNKLLLMEGVGWAGGHEESRAQPSLGGVEGLGASPCLVQNLPTRGHFRWAPGNETGTVQTPLSTTLASDLLPHVLDPSGTLLHL